MRLEHIIANRIIPAAYDLLPAKMADRRATREMVAAGCQESAFTDRYQVLNGGGRGLANGLWQFEASGAVKGVLTHPATRSHAHNALAALAYKQRDARDVWVLLEHNDVLAAVFARLLLWSVPAPLPETEAAGWSQYLTAWRPGKPHPETWATSWRIANEIVL